eukprot:54541-Eustigmatos_ZCMA.PRE.1
MCLTSPDLLCTVPLCCADVAGLFGCWRLDARHDRSDWERLGYDGRKEGRGKREGDGRGGRGDSNQLM